MSDYELERYVREKLGQNMEDTEYEEEEYMNGRIKHKHKRIDFHAISDIGIKNNREICELFNKEINKWLIVIHTYKGCGVCYIVICDDSIDWLWEKESMFDLSNIDISDIESFDISGMGTVQILKKALKWIVNKIKNAW
jgi:hypothetical protein